MARPVNANAEATRRRILDSALSMFADQGVRSSSIRAIAKGAGVSLAMVHHYYGSKDGLYSACIDEMYKELALLSDRLREELLGKTDVREIISEAAKHAFRFGREHETPVRLLQRQVVETGSLDPERRSNHQGPFLLAMTQLLGAATGREPRALRLPLQSVIMLVARYVISSTEELSFFLDADPSATEEQLLKEVEAHLAVTALRILDLAPLKSELN